MEKKTFILQTSLSNEINFSVSTSGTKCWLFELSPLTFMFYKSASADHLFSITGWAGNTSKKLLALLEQSLAGELERDETIDENIGYLLSFDEHEDNDAHLKYEKHMYYSEWIGRKYLLWWGENSISWLYTVNGCIYLEITPFYECDHDESEVKKDCIKHQQFLKNYKSIGRYEIPRENAQQLLTATQDLIDLITNNEKRSLRNRPAHEAPELQKVAIPISYKAGITKKLIAQEGYPPCHRFVLFQLCKNNEYHSFSKGKWEELDSEEQLMFINFGLTDAKGNYLL